MAQEIRHFTWCDPCIAEDAPSEPAHTVPITLDDGRVLTLDLCERHDKALLGPVRDALAAYGYRGDMATSDPRRRGQKPNGVPDIRCLWCNADPWASVTGLAGHLASVHGFPADKEGRASVSMIFGTDCPYCGKAVGSVAGFGSHMHRAHVGEPSKMSSAYVRARELGDPHGVVAKVLAMAPDGQYVGTMAAPRRKPRKTTARKTTAAKRS